MFRKKYDYITALLIAAAHTLFQMLTVCIPNAIAGVTSPGCRGFEGQAVLATERVTKMRTISDTIFGLQLAYVVQVFRWGLTDLDSYSDSTLL
jgi:hypothetical protein